MGGVTDAGEYSQRLLMPHKTQLAVKSLAAAKKRSYSDLVTVSLRFYDNLVRLLSVRVQGVSEHQMDLRELPNLVSFSPSPMAALNCFLP